MMQTIKSFEQFINESAQSQHADLAEALYLWALERENVLLTTIQLKTKTSYKEVLIFEHMAIVIEPGNEGYCHFFLTQQAAESRKIRKKPETVYVPQGWLERLKDTGFINGKFFVVNLDENSTDYEDFKSKGFVIDADTNNEIYSPILGIPVKDKWTLGKELYERFDGRPFAGMTVKMSTFDVFDDVEYSDEFFSKCPTYLTLKELGFELIFTEVLSRARVVLEPEDLDLSLTDESTVRTIKARTNRHAAWIEINKKGDAYLSTPFGRRVLAYSVIEDTYSSASVNLTPEKIEQVFSKALTELNNFFEPRNISFEKDPNKRKENRIDSHLDDTMDSLWFSPSL
jgi:hypothetical protein